jgi:hypothetical protein
MEDGSGVTNRYEISISLNTSSRKLTVARKIALKAGELPPSPFVHNCSSSSSSAITPSKVLTSARKDDTLPLLSLPDPFLPVPLPPHPHRLDVQLDLAASRFRTVLPGLSDSPSPALIDLIDRFDGRIVSYCRESVDRIDRLEEARGSDCLTSTDLSDRLEGKWDSTEGTERFGPSDR